MPLIVNGDGSLAASYKDRDLVHEFYTSPRPTETTPLNPLAPKQHAIKLRRRIKMRRFCITCLVLAELCERFAYYGIIINLVLFLDNFGWSMFASAAGVLVYSGIAWLMCSLGGLVADSRFGRHAMIVAGFLVYFIGAILLVFISIWVDNHNKQKDPRDDLPILPCLAIVLLSIAAGEGAVKANLSTFSAEQLKGEPPNDASKSFFNCFYWVANVLALFGLAGLTYVQQTRLRWSSGFTLGFAIPVVFLTLAAASFLASSKYFVVNGPHGTGLRNVHLIYKQAWKRRNDLIEIREMSSRSPISTTDKITWLDKATVQMGGTFLKSEVNEARALGKAALFSLTLVPYWIIYSHLYSTYILQGLHLTSILDSTNFIIPAAWMTLIETAVVLLMVPFLERVIYPTCIDYNLYVPRTWRVAFGMLLAAASAGMAGYVEVSKAEHFLESSYQYINQTTSCRVYKAVKDFSILQQIPQYALLGVSEIFASMSGLELVYATCPSTPQSVTSGLHNIMISIGSFLSLLIMGIVSFYGWYPINIKDDIEYLKNPKAAYYYWVLGGITLLSAFSLILIGYCFDIGVHRSRHHHHHHHHIENGDITPIGGSSANSTGNPENFIQT